VRKYAPEPLFVKNSRKLKKRDVLFILSCNRLLTKRELSLHKNNIVIHGSDLPKGRGWSPLTWQVEAGKNKIPITLFEAFEKCDAGEYYIKDFIQLDGTELIDELREKLANKVVGLVEKYLSSYPKKAIPQKGKPTYYKRRKPEHSKLNVNKSIKGQFNKMRVADNERYPLHFCIRGKKYKLKIQKF
jgi:methionyl-tRNA formyltransferase